MKKALIFVSERIEAESLKNRKVMTKLGKPRFSKCQVEVKEVPQQITIQFIN